MRTCTDGMYIATSCGEVIGKRGRVLKQILKPNGYLHFSRSEGYGNPQQTLTHRFVWEHFNGPIPKGLVVDHVDGDRLNNRLENLQVITCRENIRKGLGTKLSISQVSEIKARLPLERGRDLAKEYGVSEQLLCCIRKGRRWPDVPAKAIPSH